MSDNDSSRFSKYLNRLKVLRECLIVDSGVVKFVLDNEIQVGPVDEDCDSIRHSSALIHVKHPLVVS